VTADWLQQVLQLHDPLAAWSGAGRPGASDYRQEARLAAADLRAVLGLGHAGTIVADALDRVHPGVYRAIAAGKADDELNARLGRIARAIWDYRGLRLGPAQASSQTPTEPLPETPPVDELVGDDAALVAWLRAIETSLTVEVNPPGSPPGPAASALLAVLPRLVDAYVEADAERRAGLRSAFSRFLRVCYRLHVFAALQARLLDGPQGEEALRRLLAVESLLDLRLDWRDELLLLRDVRRVAAANGLTFDREIRRAADLSSVETARFLLGLLDAG
jgi:hypothetical protein